MSTVIELTQTQKDLLTFVEAYVNVFRHENCLLLSKKYPSRFHPMCHSDVGVKHALEDALDHLAFRGLIDWKDRKWLEEHFEKNYKPKPNEETPCPPIFCSHFLDEDLDNKLIEASVAHEQSERNRSFEIIDLTMDD